MKNPRKLPVILVLGIAVLAAICISPFGEVLLWQFDLAREFKQERTVYSDGDLEITFVQEADVDFYWTYFQVERADGSQHIVQLDHDDVRWWNPRISVEGPFYIVKGSSRWGDPPNCYFDLSTKELYSGQYNQFFTLEGEVLREGSQINAEQDEDADAG